MTADKMSGCAASRTQRGRQQLHDTVLVLWPMQKEVESAEALYWGALSNAP